MLSINLELEKKETAVETTGINSPPHSAPLLDKKGQKRSVQGSQRWVRTQHS